MTGLLLPVPLLLALAVPAPASAAPLPPPLLCPASGPQVCVIAASETGPVTIPAGAADATYLHVTATVQNQGSSTATHFTITEAPPAGTAIRDISGTDGAGRAATCSTAAGVCAYGNLGALRTATIDVVLTVTAAATPTTGPQDNANTLTMRVDEGVNDNPANGGKVDTTAFSRSLQLVPRTGTSVSSYIPEGAATTLTTDKDGKPFAAATSDVSAYEVATTEIPGLPRAITASIERSTVGACPGTCAMPDWMAVSVPDFPDLTTTGFLRTTVRVDSSLVAKVKGLSASNAVVWYQPDLATLPVALTHCTLTRTGVPVAPGCFVPTKEKDGDISVAVYERHNGRMRL